MLASYLSCDNLSTKIIHRPSPVNRRRRLRQERLAPEGGLPVPSGRIRSFEEAVISSRIGAAAGGAIALAIAAAGIVALERGRPAAAPPAAAAAQSSPWEAELRLESGRLVVAVAVDGVDSLRFIVDTAAESSAITSAVARRLGADASRFRRMRVVGVGGTRVMTSLALRTLSVGGAVTRDVSAIVLDGRMLDAGGRYDGLLGNDVLRRYDVELDVPGEVLRLHAGSADSAAHLPVTLPMKQGREGFVAFDATLGGTPVHAILDTGAPVSLLNWRAAALAGINPESSGLSAARGSAGLDGANTPTHEHRIEGLALGATRLPPMTLRIADLPLFRVAGAGSSPAMLIGVDVLRRCAALLSYRTRVVRVCAQPVD